MHDERSARFPLHLIQLLAPCQIRIRVMLLAAIVIVFQSFALAESAIYWTSGPVRAAQTVLVTGFFPQPSTISIKILDARKIKTNWQMATSSLGTSITPTRATTSAIWFALPSSEEGIYAFRIDEQGESPLFGLVSRPGNLVDSIRPGNNRNEG